MRTPEGRGPALGSDSMKLALHGMKSGPSPRDPDSRGSHIGVGALPRASASRAGPDLRPLQPQEASSWGQGRGAPRSPGRAPTCPTSGSNSRLSKFPNDPDGVSSCRPRTHLMGRQHRSCLSVSNSIDLLKPAGPSKQDIVDSLLRPPAEGSPDH